MEWASSGKGSSSESIGVPVPGLPPGNASPLGFERFNREETGQPFRYRPRMVARSSSGVETGRMPNSFTRNSNTEGDTKAGREGPR